jgi:hypothetical protein
VGGSYEFAVGSKAWNFAVDATPSISLGPPPVVDSKGTGSNTSDKICPGNLIKQIESMTL